MARKSYFNIHFFTNFLNNRLSVIAIFIISFSHILRDNQIVCATNCAIITDIIIIIESHNSFCLGN